ncbi:uncharacterized protein DUF1990 [Actinomycetospora succinea]|uniref:Uncharacterized protein DUF1990 n=1 Tax=Actinomycetospora succinea TaxID=663603 RepID=A0A4V3DA80_9PSEU|nr:DUF1990 family protein [Actinomycetospora succinea]TDQ60698.1 uncharacterized protein DUF1990 [Actinomycetospora succinea]
MAGRHLRTLPILDRAHEDGDGTDLPAPWPLALVDERTKTIAAGHGPLFHRTFTVRAVDARHGAADLVGTLSRDLDAGAPPHVVTFARERGEPGRMLVGDEYRVYMPAPWDGPVRVLARTETSFRLGTLDGHLEAGEIEFRAADVGEGAVDFTIEVWSRAGDRAAELLYGRLGVGREVQAGLWVQFCLSAVELLEGRREGHVREVTRRVPASELDGR